MEDAMEALMDLWASCAKLDERLLQVRALFPNDDEFLSFINEAQIDISAQQALVGVRVQSLIRQSAEPQLLRVSSQVNYQRVKRRVLALIDAGVEDALKDAGLTRTLFCLSKRDFVAEIHRLAESNAPEAT